MCHFLKKISFLSKTLGYLANIVFYCLTFGFPLASHCRKPTRSQGSKIDKNYFKVEYFYYWVCASFCQNVVFLPKPLATWLPLFSIVQPLPSHCRKPTGSQVSKIDKNYFKVEYFYYWACATFCKKLVFPLKPLATWLPLFSTIQPLACPWLPIVGSQQEAKDKKLMKIVAKLNISTTEHVPLSVKISFPSKTLGYLAYIVSIVQPLASPWLPIVGSLQEVKYLKLIKIISKSNISTTEHAQLSVNIYFSLWKPWLLGFHCFLSLNLWLPLGFPF